MVLRTGTFDCLIDFIIRKLEDKEILLIPILQLVLSLLGSCLGADGGIYTTSHVYDSHVCEAGV